MSTEDMFEGDIELPDVDEAEMLAILDEGDPAKIQALMAGKKPETEAEEPETDEEVVVEGEEVDDDADADVDNKKPEPKKEQDEEGAASGAEAKGEEVAQAEDDKPLVLTKDGKHTMPYSVVENLRERERQAREQLTAALAEVNQLKGGSTKLQAALEKHGIDVSAIEQGDTLSDEQIDALKELDPSVADVIRVLNARSQAMATELASLKSNPVVTPEQLAVSKNADLSEWGRSDPDRWDMACFYDDQLKVDPAYKNKSLDDRFAEAVRRTKEAFGDATAQPAPKQKSTEEIAAEKIAAAAAQPKVPKSLTDVGSTPQTERSQQEVALDIQDPDVLAAKMATMSKSQLKNFLAGVELSG